LPDDGLIAGTKDGGGEALYASGGSVLALGKTLTRM